MIFTQNSDHTCYHSLHICFSFQTLPCLIITIFLYPVKTSRLLYLQCWASDGTTQHIMIDWVLLILNIPQLCQDKRGLLTLEYYCLMSHYGCQVTNPLRCAPSQAYTSWWRAMKGLSQWYRTQKNTCRLKHITITPYYANKCYCNVVEILRYMTSLTIGCINIIHCNAPIHFNLWTDQLLLSDTKLGNVSGTRG